MSVSGALEPALLDAGSSKIGLGIGLMGRCNVDFSADNVWYLVEPSGRHRPSGRPVSYCTI